MAQITWLVARDSNNKNVEVLKRFKQRYGLNGSRNSRMGQRLSSTNFSWSILEHLEPNYP